MAEIIGTAASVITLVGTALSLIHRVRDARDRVKVGPKIHENVSKQLTELEQSLGLVREEKELQTAGVIQQVSEIAEIAEELESFLQRLAAEQQKKSTLQFAHALKSGSKEEKELQGILDQLTWARDELVLRISLAQVGLTGSLKEGFGVAFNVLMEMDDKVNKVLGKHLVLADRLKTGDRLIILEPSDKESLGLASPQQPPKLDITAAVTDETEIYNNVTLGQARIMTGNVGVDNWHKAAGRKTTIRDNRFGKDAQIMTGDLGVEAAKSFNEGFWK